jgi:hypothetical protein
MLTAGAVSQQCSRCDSPAIDAYLSSLGLMLDVDENGGADSLTDGLLVLRFLFGFTDPVLTSGDLAGNCQRCDGDAIIEYLSGLTHL